MHSRKRTILRPHSAAELSQREFQDVTGFSPAEFQLLAQRGVLPGTKVGKKWRFDAAAVKAWMEGISNQRRMLRLPRQ